MEQNEAMNSTIENKSWEEFLKSLSSVLETPIKVKEIKKIIKITDKVFPSNQCILNHYKNKFSIETNQENRSKWHNKDKLLLIWCVVKLHELDQRTTINPTSTDWDYLSQVLGVKSLLLNLKWLSLLKTNLKDAPWSQQENQLLLKIASQTEFKKNWTNIAIEFNLQTTSGSTRYAKQIRERWNNYLDPNVKREFWSSKETKMLFQLVDEIGKKWSKVSQMMEGRTENQVKNHYHSIFKYLQKNLSNQLSEPEIIELILNEQFTDLEKLVQSVSRKKLILNNQTLDQQNFKQQEPLLEKKVKVDCDAQLDLLKIYPDENLLNFCKKERSSDSEQFISKIQPTISTNIFVSPPCPPILQQSPSIVPFMSPSMMLMLSPLMQGRSPMMQGQGYNRYMQRDYSQELYQANQQGHYYSQGFDLTTPIAQQAAYIRYMQNMQQEYALQTLLKYQQQNQMSVPQSNLSTFQNPILNIPQLMNPQSINQSPANIQSMNSTPFRNLQTFNQQLNNTPLFMNSQLFINPTINTLPTALKTQTQPVDILVMDSTPVMNTPVTTEIDQAQKLNQVQIKNSVDGKKNSGISNKEQQKINFKVLQIQSSLKESLQ